MKKFPLFNAVMLIVFASLTGVAQARYVGGDPSTPPCCADTTQGIANRSAIDAASGSLTQQVPISHVGSSSIDLTLAYRSENANGDRLILDSGLGYGWTHGYNVFLFSQGTSMFRIDGSGHSTRFAFGGGGPGSGSTKYVATTGYFETLKRDSSTSFILTNDRDGTMQRFATVSGTAFAIGGPVYRLISSTDRNGLTTTVTYSGGNLTGITDPFGRTLNLIYDTGHHLTKVIDQKGRQTLLSYDGAAANRKLLAVQDPDGKTERYSYDFTNNLTMLEDKDGRRISFTFSGTKAKKAIDQSGNVLFDLTNPVNWATNDTALATSQMRLYQVDPSTGTMTTTKKDGRGNLWRYEYDANGMLRSVTAPDGAKTNYTYDPATLRLASETDANGHATTYQYDSIGNLIKQTDALGHVTSHVYQIASLCPDKVRSTSYPNASKTTYDYDARCNRTQEIRDVGGLNLVSEWTYDSQGHVLTAKDPNNHVTAYEYDVFGDQTKVTDPESHVTRYEYDAIDLRIKTIDGNGHETVYTHDGMNRLKTETDTLGFVTEYTYDGNGNRTQLRKQITLAPATYEITQYLYDLRNRLIKEIRDPGGLNLVTQYTYDGNDNRTQVTDPRGKNTSFEYDVQNRLSKVTDALTNVTETRYDPVGNRHCVIDANQHYTFLEYDALNRQIKESKKIGTQECTTGDADDIITQTFYDTGTDISPALCSNTQCGAPTPGSSNIAHIIDPELKHAYFKYDHVDRRVMTIRKVTDTADGKDGNDWSEMMQYDAAGNVLARTDANGNATTSTYFLDDLLKTEANALGETTVYTYDGAHNVKTVTSPGGNLTTNNYNDRNELIQVSDSEGPVVGSNPVGKPGYVYDGAGNRITACDGNDHCTQYAYDAVNRLIAVTDALGETSHYNYDPAGNLLKTLDRNVSAGLPGQVVCYVYDDINRRIRQVQKVGDTDCAAGGGDGNADDVWTKTVYDNVGNVTELTTAKNNGGGTPTICNGGTPTADCETTRYVYDEVNRLLQEAYPLRQAGDTAKNTREFSYDKAGNLKKRVDQKNQATDYVYNDLYYLTLRDYQIDADDRFAYDVGGRMLRAGRAGWIVTFDYDAANRVLHTTQDGKPVDYFYDIPNRHRTLTYPGGKVVTEDRDFRERLADIDAGAIATYQYDFGNRVQSRGYGNGTTATYTYNDNNWITKLEHTKAGPIIIAGFGHDYDKEGNKRFEEKQHDTARSEGYQYDDLYRLIHYKVGTLDVAGIIQLPLTQTQYDLDKLGNWDDRIKDGVTQSRQHNAVNEITQIDAAPLEYDDNGNLLHDPRYNYEYDQENRLTKVSFIGVLGLEPAGEYRYDALSRRIVKKAGPNRGNKETHYFYDDARIVEEHNTAGVTLATYTYGNYIDEVLTMERDTGGTPAFETYYYHQNALWSVEAITDSAANVVERYAYDAYGHPTITNGLGNVLTNTWGTAHSAIGNPWMFTGRQYDEETGLYYYRARYYDPDKGRFLQRDPLGYVDALNLYWYVRDNPTRFSDPFGYWSLKIDNRKCAITLQMEWQLSFSGAWTKAQKTAWKNAINPILNKHWSSRKIEAEPLKAGASICCPCLDYCLRINITFDEGWSWDEDYEVKVHQDPNFRSYVSRARGASELSSADVTPFTYTSSTKNRYTQESVAHEFGHMIGLPHPGAGLPGVAPNTTPEYEADAPALMGLGHEMRVSYWNPILTKLNTKSGSACRWKLGGACE